MASSNTLQIKKPILELNLSRNAFEAGKNLSGVLFIRLDKPARIHSLVLTCTGFEIPHSKSLSPAQKKPSSFFHRELFLTGKEEIRNVLERLSSIWKSFVGKDSGRLLSSGTHTYLFSIPLPASLPPSYSGNAGEIEYKIEASLTYIIGKKISISTIVPVYHVPRLFRGRPIAISYPSSGGVVQSGNIEVGLEVSQRSFETGKTVNGTFSVRNLPESGVDGVTISLEVAEWVKNAPESEMKRSLVGCKKYDISGVDENGLKEDFSIDIPLTAPPTIEGTTISIMWLLKMRVESKEPIELKTPITVFTSPPCGNPTQG